MGGPAGTPWGPLGCGSPRRPILDLLCLAQAPVLFVSVATSLGTALSSRLLPCPVEEGAHRAIWAPWEAGAPWAAVQRAGVLWRL